MTTPFPCPYEPPSLPPPRAPVSAYIAWTVIILSVAAIFSANFALGPRRSGGAASDTAETELRIASRMALGLKALSEASSQSQPQPADYTKMIRQIDLSSPADQLRRIIMLAELSQQPKPTDLLDQFEATNPPESLRQDAEALRIIYSKGPDALDRSAADRLIHHYGWFGYVALSYGQPATSPQRQAATFPAVRTFLAITVFSLGAVVAFLLGLTLLIVAAVRLKRGTLIRRYVPPQRPAYLLLECFAWYIGLFTAIAFILRRAHVKSPAWEWLVLAAPVAFALAWPIIRGASWAQVRQEIGLTPGRGIATEIVSGLAGWIATIPIIAVAFLITLILARYVNRIPTHPIEREIRPGLSLLYVYFLACVWAPLFEEIFFRGMLFHYMRGLLRWLASAILISLIFASIHPQGILGIPALATIAMTLAALREWRGSLIASMSAHALNNFIAITLFALVFI